MSAPAPVPAPIRSPSAEALAWGPRPVLCVAGFVLHRLWAQLPAARFGESLLLADLAALLAWPLRRWRGGHGADALAGTWLVALLVLTGPVPALAVGLLAAAAIALGGCISGRAQALVALFCGLAVIAAVVGWLLPASTTSARRAGLAIGEAQWWRLPPVAPP